MFIKRTLLTLMTLFMAVSGMPVYAEKAPAPEVTEQKDDAQASAEMESVLGIKKLYAEEPSMLATGKEFNAAIKTLAAGTSKSYYNADSLIKSVQVVNTLPSGSITTKDVSADQDGSYLAWWDAGTHTIKIYSKSGNVILNPDSSRMFDGCYSLATLDVSGWNTSQVTNMSYMLYNCTRLTTLDLSGWDTSRVTNMNSMFSYCYSLTTLDVSGWNTSQVTDMSGIFGGCSSLTTLNVSNWNTSQVTSMSSMFDSCKKLTTLDISEWDTSQVTTMSWMFNSCQSLTTLDVSKWDTGKVTNMSYMFGSCRSLTTIYIGSRWNTDKVTNSGNMFYYCYNLPNFNSSVVDKTKAYAGARGYMTLKS